MMQAEAKIFLERTQIAHGIITIVKWDYKITEKFLHSKERFPEKHLGQLYARQGINIKYTKRTLEIYHKKNPKLSN